MAFYIPKKDEPLTQEDIEWCNKMLSRAEPYEDEGVLQQYDGDPLDPHRLLATEAKMRLERGYK